jgi:RecB family exonuclease
MIMDYTFEPIKLDKSKLHIWIERISTETVQGEYVKETKRIELVQCRKEFMKTDFER